MANPTKTDPSSKPKQSKRTRTSQRESDIIADGRHMWEVAWEHRAALALADKDKERKLADDAAFKRWKGDIAIAETAMAGRLVRVTGSVEATGEELGARADLFAMLVDLKGDLELRLDDQPQIAAAFGFKNPIHEHSTPRLLALAALALAAWDKGKYRQELAQAGVTKERADALKAARERLAAADAAQKAAQSSAKGYTITKKQAVARVKANTARIRKIARLVFRKKGEVLTKFASRLPRHTPTPRKGTTQATESATTRSVQPVAAPPLSLVATAPASAPAAMAPGAESGEAQSSGAMVIDTAASAAAPRSRRRTRERFRATAKQGKKRVRARKARSA